MEIGISGFISDCISRDSHESKNDSFSFRKKVYNSLWDKIAGRFSSETESLLVIAESNI